MKSILYIGNDFTAKSKYNSTLTTLSELLRKEGFSIKISSERQSKILRLLAMCYAVYSSRKTIDYVLIDTFSTSSFYFAFFTSQISRCFRLKYIPILHGGNLPYRLKKSAGLSRMIFKNSLVNIAPSEYLKTEFEKQGFDVLYIPNTLEVANYTFKERTTFRPNLLWVRAFDSIYNPQMAIEALRLLKKDYPKVRLYMVGPRKDKSLEDCQQLIERYKLEQNVTIKGVLPKEEWHILSERYDVFVNSTNFDNTPVSVIEAMALGLPIVSTNVGGIPYLIKHDHDGILIEKDNAKQMANAITQLLDQQNLAIQLSKNARQKVEQFDWRVVRSKWLEVLSK